MKESEVGSFPSLDTCRRIESGGLIYSMSLLAFCVFHGRKNMVDLLLKEEAGNPAVLKLTVRAKYMDIMVKNSISNRANRGLNKGIVVFKKLVVFH